jgi:hypothetical protein
LWGQSQFKRVQHRPGVPDDKSLGVPVVGKPSRSAISIRNPALDPFLVTSEKLGLLISASTSKPLFFLM